MEATDGCSERRSQQGPRRQENKGAVSQNRAQKG